MTTWRVLVICAGALALAGCGVLPPATSERDAGFTPTARPATGTADLSATTGREQRRYVNERYGFRFLYPKAWELTEGQNFVSLSQGTVNLVIGYRHVSEDPNICCREQLPEGEVVEAGSITCAGQEIDRAVVRCEGLAKAVIYEGTREIALGDLRLLFYLEDFSADYDAASISTDVQTQVDDIIRSLETMEPTGEFATATPRPTIIPPTPTAMVSTPTVVSSPTAPPPSPTSRPPAVAEAQSEGANVRSGPGTRYGLTGFLEGGEQVEVTGRHADWWQIDYQGRTGWVYDGVVAARTSGGIPVVESVPTVVPSSPSVIPTAAEPSAIREDRWIDVDLSEQRLRAFEGDEVVRTTLVSTGLPDTPTVQGQYRIWIKLRHDDMEGDDYYLEDVPYAMYFYQGYGLHGTFWHNNFGQRMSHGCVNLPTEEAAWVFDFVDVGTLVNIHE